MAAEHDHTDAFRGANVTGADLTGAKFRDCDLRQVKIVDSWLVDVTAWVIPGNRGGRRLPARGDEGRARPRGLRRPGVSPS
jgi:hypothetical protein